jgi:hypothetical protein|tara:strand:+ start:514 stop:1467 length:954 start_codon:yes stop_codon:yes gene_type:complete
MKKIIVSCTAFLIGFSSFSQVTLSNAEDANEFLQAYLSPLGESLGAGLNNGWYNTAKPHKLGGFDLTFTLNTVLVPKGKQNFNPDKINNFSSEDATTPTILGKGEGATITYNGFEFNMPEQGSALNVLPVPMIGIGIGLIKKSEIDIRYVPTYKYNAGFVGKGSIGLWGVGVKHDILQWIPLVGDAFPMSLSLQAGHTSLNTDIEIKSQGVAQEVELAVKATTINLIASRKLLMFTGYAGIGYNNSTTSFDGKTSFKLGAGSQVLDFNVPLEMKFDSQNEFRANIGFRFNITVFAIQANYTFSEYPTATLGVGVSIR